MLTHFSFLCVLGLYFINQIGTPIKTLEFASVVLKLRFVMTSLAVNVSATLAVI